MTKLSYDYKTDWQTCTYSEDDLPACAEDIKNTFGRIDLTAAKFPFGGIPLLSEGDSVWVNAENENTVIFGETGSKKTRTVITPLIAASAGARESAVITDVKGELSANPKLRSYLRACGINTVCLDFRTFEGDGYNILEQPFKHFLRGEKDKAEAMIMRIVNTLGKRYEMARNDPFWSQSARQFLTPLIRFIFDYCALSEDRYEMVNMLSVNAFCNAYGTEKLKEAIENGVIDKLCPDNMSIMLRGVLGNPNNTLNCIMGTVQSFIQDFTIQKKLLYMMSKSTFDVEDMYSKPTFVFLIVPDETSTYDTISGMLIDIFYSALIETYSERYQGGKEAPCRINFICDEFCNLRINDMRSKISASRSRNMRWYLVCQSKQQLSGVYSEDAGTIIGNCKNILFLQSADTEMLDYISDLCGKTDITESDKKEPLVSRTMLRSLKKTREYKEALFIRDDIRYFALLPDFDTYTFMVSFIGSTKDAAAAKSRRVTDLKAFTPEMLDKLTVEELEKQANKSSRPKKRISYLEYTEYCLKTGNCNNDSNAVRNDTTSSDDDDDDDDWDDDQEWFDDDDNWDDDQEWFDDDDTDDHDDTSDDTDAA